jgi:D-alanine-D-alanine ligase
MKTKVGIIYGGESFEHKVSKMTAKSILENIDRELFDVKEIYIDRNGHFNREKFKNIDVAFLAVHGPNCEDGKLQTYLEDQGIKYTGSGIEASKTNMSKYLMHKTFYKIGLSVVKYLLFSKNDSIQVIEKQLNNLEFPIFIKPDNAGLSVGI